MTEEMLTEPSATDLEAPAPEMPEPVADAPIENVESVESIGSTEIVAETTETAEKPKRKRKATTKKNKDEEEEKPKVEIEENKKLKFPKGRAWYILKVQVNREDSIKENLTRRIQIAGLDSYFGEILVPTEKVAEIRGAKKKIIKRKLYPGYIMLDMEINDETWFLVRETSGIGDFTGATGMPTPMLPHEVQRILNSEKQDVADAPKLKVGYEVGQQIKVKEGNFETYEGTVDAIDYSSGRVTVILNLFGRSTPVELEYWQIEQNHG